MHEYAGSIKSFKSSTLTSFSLENEITGASISALRSLDDDDSGLTSDYFEQASLQTTPFSDTDDVLSW